MKSAVIQISVFMFLLFAGIAVVPLSESQAAPKASGWINIQPNAAMQHWTRVAIPPNRPLAQHSQWSVDEANHTLICAGNGGHEWLRYGRELGNVLFHVEWRLVPHSGKKGYNSGVFVRNNHSGLIWYQAQVGSTSGGYWFGNNPSGKGLKRFNLHSRMAAHTVKPAGEWNTFDIRCLDSKLILKVNGTVTSEFDECKNLKGYLGLEAEGSRIEFRNMRIKLLK